MVAVLWAQWRKECRNPFLTLLFIGLSILAVVIFGFGSAGNVKVEVYAGEGVAAAEAQQWIEQLNDGSSIEFAAAEEGTALDAVREGRTSVAVQLLEEDYRFIASSSDFRVELAKQHVQKVFEKELTLRAAAAGEEDPERYREQVEAYLAEPPLQLHVTTPEGGKLIAYDMGLQLMFAFSLFLAMFTVGFKINAINGEKTSGIWSRMILSPASKTQIYLGHLLFCWVIGFVQIAAVYLIFLFGFDFPLRENFGMLLVVAAIYTVGIVALATLFAGITRTQEQFHMVYPLIIPIIPVISGAYMPPGTITSKALLLAAELFPMKHAMEASLGLTLYDASGTDLFLPLVKLALFAVLCMGIGINLVERGRR